MFKSYRPFLGLIVLITLSAASYTSQAAERQVNARRSTGNSSAEYYSPTDERPIVDTLQKVRTTTLGSATSSVSPGTIIGDTWWDYQRNGSMRRMVDWGPHSGVAGTTMVHFNWTYLPTPVFDDRSYRYNRYDTETGTFLSLGAYSIQGPNDYAGYVVTDVTSDNRAVLGGHNNSSNSIPDRD